MRAVDVDVLPPSASGWMVAFAATAVSGVARARRALRAGLIEDARKAGVDGVGEYRCAAWIGADEIRSAAETIRAVRPTMESKAFDHLEYALSEVASISKTDDPPVLLLGVLALLNEPVTS